MTGTTGRVTTSNGTLLFIGSGANTPITAEDLIPLAKTTGGFGSWEIEEKETQVLGDLIKVTSPGDEVLPDITFEGLFSDEVSERLEELKKVSDVFIAIYHPTSKRYQIQAQGWISNVEEGGMEVAGDLTTSVTFKRTSDFKPFVNPVPAPPEG